MLKRNSDAAHHQFDEKDPTVDIDGIHPISIFFGRLLRGSIRQKITFLYMLCIIILVCSYISFELITHLFQTQHVFQTHYVTTIRSAFICNILFFLALVAISQFYFTQLPLWLKRQFMNWSIFLILCSLCFVAYVYDLKSAVSGCIFAMTLVYFTMLFGVVRFKYIVAALSCILICLWLLLYFKVLPSSPLFMPSLITSKTGYIIYALSITANVFFILFPLLFIYDQFMIYRNQREMTLQRISETDELTKLLNRSEIQRFFKESLSQIQANQLSTPLSIILTDIDYFKRVNDIYGHAVGDYALKQFADILKHFCPTDGQVGRQGGEEFLIVLPGYHLAHAYRIAEKIRLAFEHMPIHTVNGKLHLTASFGVSDRSAGETLEQIYHAADFNLYEAKALGRNRVICNLREVV